MTVRIVTDSTAGLPDDVIAGLGITVVPLYVLFGQQSLRDGVDIMPDEVYARLPDAKPHPTTSQPSTGDFESAYRALAAEADAIVSIHLSGKLSGTVGSALTAKAAVPEVRIEVIDSRSVCLGLGIAVARAAEAALAGGTPEAVAAAALYVIEHQRITLTLDTLEYLRRGGRLGRGAAFLGSLLSIKPVLEIKDGELHPYERVRTRPRALDLLYQRMAELEKVTDIGVMHATTPDDAERLGQRLRARFPGARLLTGQIGSVLGVHAGPGTIGVVAVQ